MDKIVNCERLTKYCVGSGDCEFCRVFQEGKAQANSEIEQRDIAVAL